ncbi:sugar ABC transporter substrate-binding protein [Lacrimispora xylanisolvens]|uniref:sugar ABC transporter substrate-binding protein n=1 Tax=Lacrimispora xylanisolvens TaxID=384636 RepID=UPI00240266DB
MKLRRVASLFLAATLLMGSLSGCAKREIPTEEKNAEESTENQAAGELEPEEGAKLIYWTASGDLEYGKAIAKEFEEKYGVPVEVQESGMDTVNKMMLDGPAGNGADVFMAAHDFFSTAKDAGILMPLEETVAGNIRNEVSEVAVRTVEDGSDLYGVPVSIETYALLYNKKLVTGEPASTMEQIAEEAKAYNSESENKFWYLTVPTDGFPAYSYLSLDGFELFGKDGNDNDNPGFDTPEFEKGLERIAALKEMLPIKADDLKMETMSLLEQNFRDGKTAYYPIGPWLVKSLKEENVDFGVTSLPTLDGKQMKSFGIVQNAHVSTYTKYPKAAQLFAEYLVSEEAAATLYSTVYKITSRKDISNVEGLKDDEALSVYAEAFENAVPMPSVKRMSYYWTIMQSVLNSVFDGKMTPAEGAAKAQSDFNDLVTSE